MSESEDQDIIYGVKVKPGTAECDACGSKYLEIIRMRAVVEAACDLAEAEIYIIESEVPGSDILLDRLEAAAFAYKGGKK